MHDIDHNQKHFAQDYAKVRSWKVKDSKCISLLDVIENVHPTILIGVSTQAGAFTQEMIQLMAKHVKHPIIFPLSNPTSRSEARPADLIKWTKGKAIIATGSPFDPVAYRGKLYQIAQCNNVYIFPGVGLALIATKARIASDSIFIEAAKILSKHSPMLKDPNGALFPTLDTLRSVTREIGIGVSQLIFKEGHARIPMPDSIEKLIDQKIWFPDYPSYA